MRKRALQVTLDVREPSIVELTIGERVQLDRLEPSHHGYVAKRHGDLLDRGVATLALDQGLYCFKTLSDANLKVIQGGVDTGVNPLNKDGGFPDPPKGQPGTESRPGLPLKGDESHGETPVLTVE
jgi:hypothetical protein